MWVAAEAVFRGKGDEGFSRALVCVIKSEAATRLSFHAMSSL